MTDAAPVFSTDIAAGTRGARAWLQAQVADAREWCEGRNGWVRAPLLLYILYAGVMHLRDPEYSDWTGGLTFGIHELGHVIMGWGGHFITALGGSLWQILVPVITIWMFRRQRDWFAVAVGFAWLAFSAWGLATYVADARAMELPLLGLSDDPEHDWNYLLGAMGLLKLDGAFALLIRIGAVLSWALALGFGGWTCWRMIRTKASDGK